MRRFLSLFFISSYLLSSCGGDQKPEKPTKTVVFDVPSFFSISPEDLDAKVGKPISTFMPTKLQVKEGITAEKTYEKEGYGLIVEYDYSTTKILNFFVYNTNKDVDDEGLEELKQIAGVLDNPTNLQVSPVKLMSKPGVYTGLSITQD